MSSPLISSVVEAAKHVAGLRPFFEACEGSSLRAWLRWFEGGPRFIAVLFDCQCNGSRIIASTLNISATERHPSSEAHSDRTPCKGSTSGRLQEVDSWSVWVGFGGKGQRATENRLKIDPLQDIERGVHLLWLKRKCR